MGITDAIGDIEVEVLIIGAGPSGSLSAVVLNNAGIKVLMLEKQRFPRFSIGESLLPQMMVFLENAGIAGVVTAGDYQLKNGAAFRKGSRYSEFNFENKFSAGPHTTFQVKRADFDMRLADEARRQGVMVRYEQEVVNVEELSDYVLITVQDQAGNFYRVKTRYVLDASGYGRVLPRLLNLEVSSKFPSRSSIYCHIKDNITDPTYDRNKILISVHPRDYDVWYWLIPFSDGTASLGVVGEEKYFNEIEGDSKTKLYACLQQEPALALLLGKAETVTDVREISGYAANVKSLFGKHYALLGNAGEFLDPVFSSGVTIAFKSAELASNLLIKMHNGESVDWQSEYATPLMKGIDAFRAFVNAWYDGSLQDIIFYRNSNDEIRKKVCSILAGYAWDNTNPYTERTAQRIKTLAQICKN